jgi:glycine hydroxymethyltransferase
MNPLGKKPEPTDGLALLKQLGQRQMQFERSTIDLIASDNAYPRAWTDHPPYAGHIIQEGLAGCRPFAGASIHDELENLGARTACVIFGAEHANLQPHSCSQANQAVYHALLRRDDPVCALGFQAGGHLTHGLRINFSGRAYRFAHFGLGDDELIDYDAAQAVVRAHRPKLIVCGSSAYPRLFDAARMRAIADDVGALLMFDLSHEAGLIAGGAIANPVPLADVVTMSLDKTLRGPFGAMILCKEELASRIDRAVHPGTQSSFSVRRLSDSVHALMLTKSRDFVAYAAAVVGNAAMMASRFAEADVRLVTGGTDKHYFIADVGAAFRMSGAIAEQRLEAAGILSSRQSLPSDESARMDSASGLRLGTPWPSSRGYSLDECALVADLALDALSGRRNTDDIAHEVQALSMIERPNDVWRHVG